MHLRSMESLEYSNNQTTPQPDYITVTWGDSHPLVVLKALRVIDDLNMHPELQTTPSLYISFSEQA